MTGKIMMSVSAALTIVAMVIGMLTKTIPNDVAMPILVAAAALLVPSPLLDVVRGIFQCPKPPS